MRPSPAGILYHPLDEILGATALVRIIRELASHGGSLSVADLAERARLTLPSVRTALRRLLTLELVTESGGSRNLMCTFRNDHPLAPVLISLFAAEREQADAVLRIIRKAAANLDPPPLAVWLYGSVARGEDRATSDIDVALIGRDSDAPAQAERLRETIARANLELAHRISIVAMSPADVRKMIGGRAKFWREIKRDAVVLMGDAPTDFGRRAPKRAARG